MRIHYISCHSVLEYDENIILRELGHTVDSNGAYRDPRGAYTLPRPALPNAQINEDFFNATAVTPHTALTPNLIEPYDAIIVMHSPDVLLANWERIKHKRVIWRSIGQSTPSVERKLKPLVAEGLQIVRYSVKEKNIPDYIGEDATIYFYKDSEEFKDWNGDNESVVNFSQSLLGRRYFLHYDELMGVGEGFDFKVYGSGNDDLGKYNGGDVPYEMMKQIMRNSRVFLYGGTWPACYTLSFIEAMMTGMPVVALGEGIAHTDRFEKINFYEIPDIIENGLNGFYSDDIGVLRNYVQQLIHDKPFAQKIGEAGRRTAIKYFGKEKIKQQWQEFLAKV